MSYYVYELIDPRDGLAFYVGKGKKGRIDQHEAEARKGRQSRKCDRIREIEAEGLKIKKRKASVHDNERAAYIAEAELICEYGLANLTNVSPGGGGGVSAGPSVYEDRKAVVEATKLFRRIRGVDLSKTTLFGKPFDLSFMREHMQRLIERIAKRRSWAWVNEIAAQYNTEYVVENA